MLSTLKRIFNRPPSREKFADMTLGALQRAWPASTFTLNQDKFQIQESDGVLISLHNVYLDYCHAEPSARSVELDRFVKGVVAPRTKELSYEDAKSLLLPVFRNLSGLDLVRIETGDDKSPSEVMAYRPLSEELGIAVAIDSELTITQVGSDAFKRWGKTFDEILEVAFDNLRHKAAPSFHQLSPGLFVSGYGDYYDAPRMLLPELIWQLPVGATPVAMVPNRNGLLVCSAEDTAAVDNMVAQARPALLEESRPLSAEMFKLTDKTWTTWCPPGESGVKLRRLQRESLAGDYAEQKQALEALHEKSGEDIFVATYQLVQRKDDGQLISFAVLSRDVHTWLPKADVICLLEDPDADALIVTMADFLESARPFIRRLPYVLPRYEATEFPDAACMTRLRERATTLAAASV
jgi:hypothetical protein